MTCQRIADETGARLTLTDDVDEGVRGVDYLYTDVWVSMGEDQERLGGADRAAHALPGQRGRRPPDGQPGRATSCTACRRSTTARRRSARRSSRPSGSTAWRSPTTSSSREHSIVFDQAENRMHTIKAVMVATLGD